MTKFRRKLKQDLPPLAFFGVLVAIKSYYLIDYLGSSQKLWHLLTHISSLDEFGRLASYYLTHEISYILFYLTALAFDVLVFFSFVIRTEAKERPKGFWEVWFPLMTVFIPVTGFTLLFIPEIRGVLPGYPEGMLDMLTKISPIYPFFMSMLGFVVGFIGVAFSIWSLSYLKRSFGLRAAVRELVTRGPYKVVRHPLYFGEILHILGIAILSAKPAALGLFIVAVMMQIVRARVEEKKFLNTLPEYETYMRSTGFLWPRFKF
jgi:protein-S-isoprenylcysteine O-methyltransferase Ste14